MVKLLRWRLRPRHPKTSRKRKIIWTTLLIIILIILAFLRSLQGPAQGTIKVGSELGRLKKQADIHLTAKNFSLDYPANYTPTEVKQHPDNIKEAYTFTATGAFGQRSRNVAITIFDLPDANLDNNSSYKYRRTNPSLYLERVTSLNGNEARFFKRTDGTDTTVFIQQGNKLASIASSGVVGDSVAESDFNLLLNSWHWRR